MMQASRFEALIDAYGADPARWPDAERASALAFAEANPDLAARLTREAARLDAALALARVEAPSPALMADILKSADERNGFAPPWARLAAAIAISAGLGLGWGGASLGGAADGEAAYALAFSSFAEPAYDDLADFIEDEVR